MATLEVYQADEDDFYVGPTYADENPVRPGEFLMPRNAYSDAPDLTQQTPHTAFKRSDDLLSWILVPNYQGVEYWLSDGSSSTISQKGVSLPTGASLTEITAPLTQDQQKAIFTSYVQTYIDQPAVSWGYDSAAQAISYIGDPYAQFNADGEAMRTFRSQCWVIANQMYAQVLAGTIPIPTKETLLASLPIQPTQPVLTTEPSST